MTEGKMDYSCTLATVIDKLDFVCDPLAHLPFEIEEIRKSQGNAILGIVYNAIDELRTIKEGLLSENSITPRATGICVSVACSGVNWRAPESTARVKSREHHRVKGR